MYFSYGNDHSFLNRVLYYTIVWPILLPFRAIGFMFQSTFCFLALLIIAGIMAYAAIFLIRLLMVIALPFLIVFLVAYTIRASVKLIQKAGEMK